MAPVQFDAHVCDATICGAGGAELSASAIPCKHGGIGVRPPALPTWGALGKGVLLPNHSAARLGPLVVGLVVVELARPATAGRAALAGIGAAWMLLWNIETGIAAAGGIAAYTWLRAGGLARPAPAVGRAAALAAGGAIGVGLFLAAWTALLGRVPDLFHPQGWLWPLTAADDDGLPSLAMVYDPLAPVLYGGAIYALWRTAWRPRPAPVDHRAGLRAAAATVILVWGVYYFHRPYEHKLLTSLVVGGVLLADVLPLLRRPPTDPRTASPSRKWTTS